MSKKSINKIVKELKSLEKVKNIRYMFSYITIGDSLSEIESEVVDNLDDGIASNALIHVIDEKIFGNTIEKSEDEIEMDEVAAKLHMFNLFNKGKKFKA